MLAFVVSFITATAANSSGGRGYFVPPHLWRGMLFLDSQYNAGTTAAGVDRTSIGRGPTHTTYPLGDILTAGVWGKFLLLRQPSASAVVRKRT